MNMADTLQPNVSDTKHLLQEKLSLWDAKLNPKAPLSDRQKDGFIELTTLSANRRLPVELPVDDIPTNVPHSNATTVKEKDIWAKFTTSMGLNRVETAQQFFSWFAETEGQMEQEEGQQQREFLENVQRYKNQCDEVIEEVEQCLEFLTVLKTDYVRVATKTNALHEACENLLEEQTQLVNAAESINSKLGYFNELDRISTKLNLPTCSVNSEGFLPILSQLDECIEYLNKHPQYKESSVYLVKFKHCLSRALGLLKSHVFNVLQAATKQVLPTKNQQLYDFTVTKEDIPTPVDDAFTLFYGKFRTNAPRVKALMEQVEMRLDKSPEYQQLLNDCHQCYFQQRLTLLAPSVASAVTELATKHSRDHCALVRSGCAFMIHVCEDEHQLFFHFFSKPTPLLDQTLESLCTNLYDVLRPLIIHVNHLETLAELCSILKVEMMEEHIQNNSEQLVAFDMVCGQMLQDVQERLVYRTHIFIRQEILNYNPAPGDLAYPGKLEMMESIAEKIKKEQQDSKGVSLSSSDSHRFVRNNSVSSTSSMQSAASLEVEQITAVVSEAGQRIEKLAHESTDLVENGMTDEAGFVSVALSGSSNMPMSPADLHGMWYPTVRRTLVCLSKLYRCIDRTTFQGLSQETLSMCIQSLIKASDAIAKKQSLIDGHLFLIKHLLILREQIAPFHIDSAVKEMALDFSKIRNAAVELLRARSKLFSFGSNNAVLQFLLEGTPAVTETFIDSRKEVDKQLKKICEEFIQHISDQFIGQLRDFLSKANIITQMCGSSGQPNADIRKQPFASPEKLREIVTATYKNLKQRKTTVQRSMSLYLANRDTEYILFKPLKGNVQQCFQQLHLLLNDHYSDEDKQIIAAPSVEQVNLLLSNTTSRRPSVH